jgi:hypothetical protein
VSLVLEALKKLDREKGRDERGFVVMAAAPWPTRAARRWPVWVALAVVAVAVATVVALRPPRAAAPVAPAPAAAPVAPPVAAPAAAVPPAAGSEARPLTSARSAPASPAVVAPPAAEDTARASVSSSTPAPVAAAAPAAMPAAEPVLRLQAISQRDGQPIAIVNDHLVRVGDEIDGIRVLAIRAEEVDVEFHGRRTTLRF